MTPGLTLCGQAFEGTLDADTPFGPVGWSAEWLAQKARTLENKLALLERVPLVAQEDDPSLQVALLILRSLWPGSFLHLLRQLPWQMTQAFAEQVDSLLYATLARLCGLTALNATQKNICSLPVSHGGLGLPAVPSLALAARISLLATIPKPGRCCYLLC